MRYKVTLERSRQVLESGDLEVEAGSKEEAKALAKTKAEKEFDRDDWEVFDEDFAIITVADIEVLGPSEGETPLAFPDETPDEKLREWNKMVASAKAAG